MFVTLPFCCICWRDEELHHVSPAPCGCYELRLYGVEGLGFGGFLDSEVARIDSLRLSALISLLPNPL